MSSRAGPFQALQNRPILVAVFICTVLGFLLWANRDVNKSIRRHVKQDRTDIFAHWHGRDRCGFGATDLHAASEPMCQNTSSLLSSMSDGGRGGFDMPYQPRGCDLRFYDTDEICEILSRYEGIVLYGDSLLRHLAAAFAMLVRENMEWGGQLQWLHNQISTVCLCDGQTELLGCHQSDVSNIEEVYVRHPQSIKCRDKVNLRWEAVPKYPINEEEFKEMVQNSLKQERPEKPYAFIFGNGLWNDLHMWESMLWVDAVQAAISSVRPYYREVAAPYPKIFVGPNAAGEEKGDAYIPTQSNKAIMKFEKFMRRETGGRGLDFLGTYNMSVQATIPDGTHSGIRTNLLKAMTIINWLDMQDTEQWRAEMNVAAS